MARTPLLTPEPLAARLDLIRRWIASIGTAISLWAIGHALESLGIPEPLTLATIFLIGIPIGLIVWGDYKD